MRPLLLADDEWRASPTVSGADDAILGKNHHGARTLDVMIDILDTLLESLALDDEQCHQLGRIGTARRHLGKVHVLFEQVLSKFFLVYYLGHRANGKAPKMRIHDKWLSVSIADNTDARSSSLKTVERRFELRSEVRAFEVVDRAHKALVLAVGCQTASASAEM